MTRAVNLANFADNTILTVDGVNDRVGIGSTQPSEKLNVVGVVSATSFFGDGSNLSGITAGATLSAASGAQRVVVTSLTSGTMTAAGTDADLAWNSTTNTLSATNISVGGTLTYNDVTNIDSVGLVTARTGVRVSAGGIVVAGVATASNGLRIGTGGTVGPVGSGIVTYFGDGSNLTGVVSGIEVKNAGSSVGTSLTALNFTGATVTASQSAGISTIAISAAGITSTQSSPSANTVITLNLGSAQHHDLRLSAGISTITCTGGTAGESHSVVITQPSSGIATVGFSTYFLFPSGASPSMSEGSSKVDLISFVIKIQGSTGVATALLASAGLNYQ